MVEELWAIILEAPHYEVSSRGKVRNRDTLRLLKTRPNGRGQEQVDLRDSGITMTRSIDALRKRAFE